MESPKIVVAGAGTIGCYLGGLLVTGGAKVNFWGRARICTELAEFGLTLTDCDGARHTLPPGALKADTEPVALPDASLILVTVKSGATAQIGSEIAKYSNPDALVVSLQNGVGNVAVLRSQLPGHRVMGAMVPFNVVHMGEGRFHRATGGALVIDANAGTFLDALRTSGLAAIEARDMQAVYWGKLLLNLNNALNALSGLPLAEQLADREWRLVLADCIVEALAALKRSGIEPARAGPIAPAVLPHFLRLPNWLFRQVARRQLQIDPLARSSMWEDLERRRLTEIDYLQGAVVDLADKVGLRAAMNSKVRALIHDAQAQKKGPPRLAASVLRRPVG